MSAPPPPGQPPEHLLDLIYDAASEEALWTKALTAIAALTHSVGGYVFGAQIDVHRTTFVFNGGLSEEAHRIYRERHMVNPLSTVMNGVPVGKVLRSDDIIALPALRRTALFDEVWRPQDISHTAQFPLIADASFLSGFNLSRSARLGPYTAEELRLLAQLYPHLRRSLQLGFRLEAYSVLRRAELDLLDRLAVGIVVLSRGGGVLLANAAARSMTAGRGPLRLHGAALTAVLPADARRFGALIDRATRGDALIRLMSLPHPEDGRLVTVQIASLRGRDLGRLGDLGLQNAAAMVVIRDPAQPADLPLEALMDAYGLTHAEARVAAAAASGAAIPEIASLFNISPNTVKTHLRKVFAKTGTSRQAELVRLLAAIATVRLSDLKL